VPEACELCSMCWSDNSCFNNEHPSTNMELQSHRVGRRSRFPELGPQTTNDGAVQEGAAQVLGLGSRKCSYCKNTIP
jgi:hypothetical protein